MHLSKIFEHKITFISSTSTKLKPNKIIKFQISVEITYHLLVETHEERFSAICKNKDQKALCNQFISNST